MLRKRLTTIGIIAVIALTCSNAWGFDGLRKGFVLGGGLGFSPSSKWSGPLITAIDNNTNAVFIEVIEESKAGIAVNLLVGYAWDEQNMLVYEFNASAYQSDIFIGDRVISQGFSGAAWYHYFGSMGSTLFSVLGIGIFTFELQDADSNDPGIGGMVGGGYEFSNHWQVGAYVSAGKTSDALKNFFVGIDDWSHVQVNVLVNAIAF